MLSPDTFLLTLYVSVDDFCKAHPAVVEECSGSRGKERALTVSEVITLSVFSQWVRFRTERGFYHFAEQKLLGLFPKLPKRSQFNRATRACFPGLVAFFRSMAGELNAHTSRYEVLDRCGIVTRASGRRGSQWLHGYADKGLCGRLGYFHGLQLLTATTAEGVITGFGLGPGSAKDQPMAEAFFATRAERSVERSPEWPWIGQAPAGRIYVLDKGFSGPARHLEWKHAYGVEVFCAPQKGHGPPWPKALAKWVASLRQIIETVHDKLLNWFRLERERPHDVRGIFTRLAAKAALNNFCIWLNRQLGRPPLAFADLLGW
jgi:hypothetical protein